MDRGPQPVKSVLIIGGGTAGWLTAALLARTLATSDPDGVRICLVESPQIGSIGVGEGTFPSIRATLATIGIDEARFLRASQATFKQGITFVDWVRAPGGAGANHYFHPFSLPSQRAGMPELLPYWLQGAAGPGRAFAEAVTLQKAVADAGRGPKRSGDADYAGVLNYAYHFDAARFADLLAVQARALGVQHLPVNVDQVRLAEDGAIEAVVTREHGALRADLYVDCTGFRAALIGGALGAPFRGVQDVLFVDRALALQLPYPRPDSPIASYTIATAREAGWIWDIGLQQRRGTGYVYSSRHTSDGRAEEILRAYAGAAGAGLEPRKLRLEVGYRPTQWVRNCVAVGLSAGFVEPLEASGIGLIETAAYLIAYLFPHNGEMAPVARRFNDFMSARFERVIEFVKMHYCLSQRTDSSFWTDNTDAASLPPALAEKLAMWRCRPPNRLDFLTDLEMYQPASWQFVLYGMEFPTRLGGAAAAWPRAAEAQREFETIRRLASHAVADLPDHRSLVERMATRAEAATMA